jgi:hypothetical protein
MRCIICLEDRPSSEEHVFPLAIGGRLTIDRVCRECNSDLGSRIDPGLTDNFIIKNRRADLGLSGNSGNAPPPYEMLTGVSRLKADPTRKVAVTFNEKTQKIDVRSIPQITDVTLPDGNAGQKMIIDAQDLHLLPKLLQRERKRHGLPPLTPAQLGEEIAKISRLTPIEEPARIVKDIKVDFSLLHFAFIKIAYELAFIWLGDSYLDDPMAAKLRAAIRWTDGASAQGIHGRVEEAEGFAPLTFWAWDKTSHLAYSFASGGIVNLVIRIFDIYAAQVCVSQHLGNYLKEDGAKQLRFLSIDPIRKTMEERPMMLEMRRLADSMGSSWSPP